MLPAFPKTVGPPRRTCIVLLERAGDFDLERARFRSSLATASDSHTDIRCLKRFGIIAGCRSLQEDSAINYGCQPFEQRCETSVPARSHPSSRVEHERSIGAGSRRECPVLGKASKRVRRCGLRMR